MRERAERGERCLQRKKGYPQRKGLQICNVDLAGTPSFHYVLLEYSFFSPFISFNFSQYAFSISGQFPKLILNHLFFKTNFKFKHPSFKIPPSVWFLIIYTLVHFPTISQPLPISRALQFQINSHINHFTFPSSNSTHTHNKLTYMSPFLALSKLH